MPIFIKRFGIFGDNRLMAVIFYVYFMGVGA